VRPGPITLCLLAGEQEVDVDTGAEFPITPEIKGAIKSLSGVMHVEEI